MRSTTALVAAAGLSLLALAAACGGGGGGGAGEPDAGGGSGGGASAITICKAICDSASTACPELTPDTIQGCVNYCDFRFSHPRAKGCQPELLAYYQCLSKPNNAIECLESYWDFQDSCLALDSSLDQCMAGEAICGVASPPASGGACYAGRGECNLMLDDCPAGFLCGTEYGGGTKCFAAAGSTVSVCAECDAISVDCKGGSTCYQEHGKFQCVRYCCTDADCDGTPGSCWEYDTEYHIKMCYR